MVPRKVFRRLWGDGTTEKKGWMGIKRKGRKLSKTVLVLGYGDFQIAGLSLGRLMLIFESAEERQPSLLVDDTLVYTHENMSASP